MKKILLIIAVMFISVISFAQTKGEMFIAGTVSADLGTQKTTLSDGSYSTSAKQPLSSSFGFGVEYGYFVADNLRLALAMSVPFSAYITLNVPPVALSIVPLQKRLLSVRQSYDYF